jgi:hypothetical protein
MIERTAVPWTRVDTAKYTAGGREILPDFPAAKPFGIPEKRPNGCLPDPEQCLITGPAIDVFAPSRFRAFAASS